MKLERNILDISSKEARVLYRFQGGYSYPSFNIKGDDYGISDVEHYTYFSKNIDHHKYFVSKRLKQLIAKTIFDEKGMILSTRNLSDPDFYRKVKTDIANTYKIDNLESIRFLLDNNFLELIEQNYEYNSDKSKGSRIIERVDRRVYGGGYGIGDEWLKLFNLLTILYERKEITRSNLISMLSAMRCGFKSKLETVDFLSLPANQTIVNTAIYSDFTRFKIAEILEEILDKGLYKKDSDLGKKPSYVIKKVTNDYIDLRDEALRKLEKSKKR